MGRTGKSNNKQTDMNRPGLTTLTAVRVVVRHAHPTILSEGIDRVGMVRQALRPGGEGRMAAVHLLVYLSAHELQQLFEDLIYISRSNFHGLIEPVRQAILSIPKEWLLDNIATTAEPYLESGDGEDYKRFLELYERIDHSLAKKLALRALEQDDDVKEAALDLLETISKAKSERNDHRSRP